MSQPVTHYGIKVPKFMFRQVQSVKSTVYMFIYSQYSPHMKENVFRLTELTKCNCNYHCLYKVDLS